MKSSEAMILAVIKAILAILAQLVRASHRYCEVMGSNPVEVLKFSGFSTQLLKLPSKLRESKLHLTSYRQFNI